MSFFMTRLPRILLAAQVVGAFVGAALVFLVYHNAIDAFNLAA
jgi:glycerol uptake facilitator protein